MIRKITDKKLKIHVRKGDIVKIISGKDKKKVGKITKIFSKTGRITVENINIKTKHIKAKKEGESGQIRQIESSMHSSNVMLYSYKSKTMSRFSVTIDEKNTKRRKLKKTGEIIANNDKK